MSSQNKTALFCVEQGLKTSKPAFEWALKHLMQEGDTLHVVTVLPPIDFSPTPGGPLAAYAAGAIAQSYEMQKKRNELTAVDTLKEAVEVVDSLDLKLSAVETHALNATGGASGVASSIVEYANRIKADVAVLGSRGGGALQRSLRSVVGLGSVSDYAVHNMHCPLLVVRQGCLETFEVAQPASTSEGAAAPPKRKICLACDSSDASKAMIQWTLDHLITPEDEVHIVSVATPVEYPVLDDTSPAVCAMETKYWQDAKNDKLDQADHTAREFVGVISKEGKIPLEHVWYKALQPEGGASGVGESLLHYVKSNHNNMLIVGNRDLGPWKRAMTSFLGLGSVSEYLTHNAPCPVLVFKHKRPSIEA